MGELSQQSVSGTYDDHVEICCMKSMSERVRSLHRDGQAEASQSRNLPNRAGGVGKAKGARPLVSLAFGGSPSPSPSLSEKDLELVCFLET